MNSSDEQDEETTTTDHPLEQPTGTPKRPDLARTSTPAQTPRWSGTAVATPGSARRLRDTVYTRINDALFTGTPGTDHRDRIRHSSVKRRRTVRVSNDGDYEKSVKLVRPVYGVRRKKAGKGDAEAMGGESSGNESHATGSTDEDDDDDDEGNLRFALETPLPCAGDRGRFKETSTRTPSKKQKRDRIDLDSSNRSDVSSENAEDSQNDLETSGSPDVTSGGEVNSEIYRVLTEKHRKKYMIGLPREPMLPENHRDFPSSELLETIHSTASHHYATADGQESMFRSLDSTALVAAGILCQELVKHLVKPWIRR